MSGQNVLKRAAIERILKESPELTDRAIAERVEIEISPGAYTPGLARVSPHTAAPIRKELEQKGDILHTTERIENSGRKARGRKPRNGGQT
jgi:hypothetical protein